MADSRALLIFNEADIQQAQIVADELNSTHTISGSNWRLYLEPHSSNGIPSTTDGYRYVRDYDWFILIRTPRSLMDQNIDIIVHAAFTATTSPQSSTRLQNIFAIGDPVSVQSPKWPTIRTYDFSNSAKQNPKAIQQLHNSLIPVTQPKRGTGLLPPEDSIQYQQGVYAPPTFKRPSTFTSQVKIALIGLLLLILLAAAGYAVKNALTPVIHPASPQQATLATPNTNNPGTNTKPTPVPTLSPDALLTSLTKDPNIHHDVYNFTKEVPGWDKSNTCNFRQDGYHVTNANINEYAPCIYHQTPFKNFVYEVQVNLKKGDMAGLILRADNQLGRFYRVSFISDGTYNLISCTVACSNPFNTTQGTPLNSAKGNAKTSAQLTIIVQNNQFYLYIDHAFVLSVSDDSIPDAGNIGLYAGSTNPGQPTEAVFNNARVWTLK